MENFLRAAEVELFQNFESQKGLKIRLKWCILDFSHISWRNVHFWSSYDQFWARMVIVRENLRRLVIKFNMKVTFWSLSKTLAALLCRCGHFFDVHASSESTKISIFTWETAWIANNAKYELESKVHLEPFQVWLWIEFYFKQFYLFG